MDMITSTRNPLIKRLRRLQRRKYRLREHAFYIEGVRTVLSALEQGAPVETVVYSPDLLTSDVALRALETYQERGGEVVPLAAELFDAFAERDNPVGLGAIVGIGWTPLEQLPLTEQSILVALVEPADPGNVGTILRTIDSVGGDGLILVGQSTDPFHPTAVKASMGALFSVPVVAVDDLGGLTAWAAASGIFTVATSAHAETTCWQAPYRFPALLLMGSERHGLPDKVRRSAATAVRIPMYGAASSLNLAVATGILLYELRRAAGPP